MRALDAKLARDLWRLRGQVLAIALVLAAATATFIMSLGVHQSLSGTRDAYYARNQFGDLFAGLTRAPAGIVARVAALPGVAQAEGRIQHDATLDMPGREEPVRALLNGVGPGGGQLNRLTLRRGRLPDPAAPAEVVVDEAFADANRLAPGDVVMAVLQGRRLELNIVGIGLAPDFIYALGPGDILPDDRRFGVFWMGERALAAATDRQGAINALSLTLTRDANEAEVMRSLDALLAPHGGSGVYARRDHLSHAFVENELMQLDAITRVIPPVFLGVAVFLVSIVMSRMIRTERGQIGLMKAFGYTEWAIAGHYLKLALVIALIATLVGAIAGIRMGAGMTDIYSQYYHFPFLDYRVSPAVIGLAALLSFGAAALGALGGMRMVVALTPAAAMSPPPPPVYQAGPVERWGQRAGLSAIGNMILRHVARWPGRSAITVLGVALSGGLLFSNLQFIDASATMVDAFFFRAQRQDLTVTFTEPRRADALHALARLPGVIAVEPARGVPVKLIHGPRIERTMVEASPADSMLSLRIDRHGDALPLPAEGLMLSRQLADKLDITAGGMVRVELLGGRRTEARLPVTAIIDEYIGARAYAAGPVLARLTGDGATAGAALLRIDPASRVALLAQLKAMPMVLGVTEKAAAVARFEDMIDDNLLTMIVFFVGFATAITVGVVYNSARIILSERAHELATLRVLGYYRSEVALVLLGELALLVAVAVPFACLVGNGLARLMVALFSSDLFRLPFAPARASYGWSVVAVLAAALVTAAVVARRVQGLDMVRVLKARE